MSTEPEDLVGKAVHEQRLSGDKHFVYITHANRHLIGLRAALEAEAAESGRILLHEMAESPTIIRARGTAIRDVPEIQKTDDRGFLENLGKIARGDVRVVG